MLTCVIQSEQEQSSVIILDLFCIDQFQVYIEDGLGDRVWVDLPGCHSFTANVCTVFNTLSKPDSDLVVLDESDLLYPVLSQIEIQPRYMPVVCVCTVVHVRLTNSEMMKPKSGVKQVKILPTCTCKYMYM